MGKVLFKLDKGANKNFIENYECVFSNLFLEGQEKIIIDDKNNICRFCGRNNKEVSFKNISHAVPEAFGNKKIITKNECDECNQKYANIIENDLLKLTLPSRNMTAVCGKNGVPKYKDMKTNNSCEYKDRTFKITDYNNFCRIDEEKKQVILNFETPSMVPLKAYKALVRMALNCLPKEIFDKFNMIEWLESDEDLGGATNFYTKVIIKFVPKISKNFIMCLFIRKENISNVPYCQMVLQSNNIFYQVIIPFINEDKCLENEKVIIEPFSFGIEDNSENTIDLINLSSNKKGYIPQKFILNYTKKEIIE